MPVTSGYYKNIEQSKYNLSYYTQASFDCIIVNPQLLLRSQRHLSPPCFYYNSSTTLRYFSLILYQLCDTLAGREFLSPPPTYRWRTPMTTTELVQHSKMNLKYIYFQIESQSTILFLLTVTVEKNKGKDSPSCIPLNFLLVQIDRQIVLPCRSTSLSSWSRPGQCRLDIRPSTCGQFTDHAAVGSMNC